MAAAANGVDYGALIALWPTLTPGTTAAKLAQVNAMVVTGTVPGQFTVTGAQLFDAINFAEFTALAPADQTLIMQACQLASTQALAAGAGSMLRALFLAKFAPAGPTITALAAMAKGLSQPWWQANGYHSPFNLEDLHMAGNLT